MSEDRVMSNEDLKDECLLQLDEVSVEIEKTIKMLEAMRERKMRLLVELSKY